MHLRSWSANRTFRGDGLIDAIGPCASARGGAAICPESGEKRKCVACARNDVNDPSATFEAAQTGGRNVRPSLFPRTGLPFMMFGVTGSAGRSLKPL